MANALAANQIKVIAQFFVDYNKTAKKVAIAEEKHHALLGEALETLSHSPKDAAARKKLRLLCRKERRYLNILEPEVDTAHTYLQVIGNDILPKLKKHFDDTQEEYSVHLRHEALELAAIFTKYHDHIVNRKTRLEMQEDLLAHELAETTVTEILEYHKRDAAETLELLAMRDQWRDHTQAYKIAEVAASKALAVIDEAPVATQQEVRHLREAIQSAMTKNRNQAGNAATIGVLVGTIWTVVAAGAIPEALTAHVITLMMAGMAFGFGIGVLAESHDSGKKLTKIINPEQQSD